MSGNKPFICILGELFIYEAGWLVGSRRRGGGLGVGGNLNEGFINMWFGLGLVGGGGEAEF